MIEILLLVLVVYFGLIYPFTHWAKKRAQFRPDDFNDNPYRRYCRTCEQCQTYFTWGEGTLHFPAYGWWEPQGEIEDELCPCHDYTEYHG